MKPIIYIDIDQTLNKLWETFVAHYNKTFNKAANIERDMITVYSLPELLGVPKNERAEVANHIFNIPHVWTEMPVFEDSIPIVKELNEMCELYIATTPWPTAPFCCREKIEWMYTYFPFIKNEQIIFIHNKGLLRGNLLIDDSPSNLKSFQGHTIAFDYPYNKECVTSGRIHDWKNAMSIIKTLISPTSF